MEHVGARSAGRTAALALATILVGTCGLGQEGLPPAYVGSWTGTVHDDSPPGFDYTFDANIHGGPTGEIVGTFTYPCCGGNLRLLEVGKSSVELAEEYTYNPCGCITTNACERLVAVDEDTLRLEWHYAGETRIWVYGDLERRVDGFETETIAGYLVTAPNGNRLWTKVIQPRQDVYGGLRFPAVVSVPGLTDAAENDDLHVAANGVIEFHFNAEGRGQAHRSDGSENLDGFVHQDDLKAVIQFAQSRPNVLLGNFGVVDLSDAVSTLGFLFLGGPAPPAASGECGEDETGDEVDCAAYSPCG